MKLEIDIDFLKRDIENLKVKSQSLKSSVSALESSMSDLNNCWEGVAKTAYLAQYQKDIESITDLIKMIEKIIAILEFAKEQYYSCNLDVQAAVSTIRV